MCVYVCVCVYVRACVRACVRVCITICIYIYIIYIYVYIYLPLLLECFICRFRALYKGFLPKIMRLGPGKLHVDRTIGGTCTANY